MNFIDAIKKCAEKNKGRRGEEDGLLMFRPYFLINGNRKPLSPNHHHSGRIFLDSKTLFLDDCLADDWVVLTEEQFRNLKYNNHDSGYTFTLLVSKNNNIIHTKSKPKEEKP